MTDGPDDLRWLPESKMLGLCRLPRSVLNSWKRAGLDLSNDAGAYGLDETIAVLLLGAAREHIQPAEMAEAWREVVASGRFEEIARQARQFDRCERFDLVIDPRYAELAVATSDASLIDAVSHPAWPRPVVVVDVAEGVATVVRAFGKVGKPTKRPTKRQAGRPRSGGREKVVEMHRRRGT